MERFTRLRDKMAFPSTYNISYYKGDTLEFRIHPKDSSGNTFDLDGYEGSEKFTIAPARGNPANEKVAFAEISDDKTYILCTIEPDIGLQLTAGTTYYYDIQIDKSGTDYDYVYTLLTGTITVTEHVTGATV
jgi:hypothetical protein